MRKLALAIIPAALVAAPLALAAPPIPPAKSPPPMEAPTPSTQATVDSATLHKFASAYEDIRQVRMEYMLKMKTAKTDKDKTAIKQEATTTMKQHIQKHMPVAEYIKVSKAVQANPALRKRLVAIIKSDMHTAAPGSATRGG